MTIDRPRVLAALPLAGTVAAALFSVAAMAQQGAPPPAGPATHVESGELHESWNGRVSQGAPVGAYPEFNGWSMGATMPLPRSEHAVAEFGGAGHAGRDHTALGKRFVSKL